jgi:hypothetical protein
MGSDAPSFNAIINMTTRLLIFVATLIAAFPAFGAAPAAPANTRVVVMFENPENFRDVRDDENGSESGRDGYLNVFKEHLEKNAARHLSEGQTLTITFTDIDMAGDFEAWRGPKFQDVRIIKDVYPPRMTFSFKVTDASGAVVKEGARKLVDQAFQMRMGLGRGTDSLFYEKDMLNDWLRSEFAPAENTSRKS